MINNVSEYLDNSAKRYPNKVAFVDKRRSVTFEELKIEADHIAGELVSQQIKNSPVAVFLDKSVECIGAFVGIAKSGNFYSPIDTKMPEVRIKKIFHTLRPVVIITDNKHRKEVENFNFSAKVLIYEQTMDSEIDIEKIQKVSKTVLDTDLLYVLFTSGSTGTPKGVMISQQGLIDFTEWATDYFEVDSSFVFGNQCPFYFSFSVWDIYLTLKNGATAYIIPRELFSYPADLMKYLYEKRINTVVWVPSALCMISTFRALNSPHLDALKNVWFGAEVMPVKQLNRWIQAYPSVRFVNTYGSTEVMDTCTIYEVNRKLDDAELLPIGENCKNKEVILLDSENKVVAHGEVGEICVRGRGIAYGYYNDREKTKEVFIQNPLHEKYVDIIYKTGDLAKYNDYNELVYVSRKDFQIKHQGHRIELGEIEVVVSSLEGVENCCCLYDTKKLRIYLFYIGEVEEKNLMEKLKSLLPEYMLPNKRIKMSEFPFNLNGKIDRQKLKELM